MALIYIKIPKPAKSILDKNKSDLLVSINASTGGTTKDGNNWGIVKEATNSILGKETTAHNCYEVGTSDCDKQGLLINGQPMKWEAVYEPKKNNQGVKK